MGSLHDGRASIKLSACVTVSHFSSVYSVLLQMYIEICNITHSIHRKNSNRLPFW